MMTRAVSRVLPFLLLSMLAMAAELDMLPNERTLKLVRDRFGGEAVERMKQWRELVSDARALNDPEKLDRVNRFFNRIPNISDDAHWQQRDYWATPVQLLATHGGDCEDFALAKYFSLRAAGVAEHKLRITYVRAYLPKARRMEAHMVLAYYEQPDGEPLILDNLDPDVKPAAERTDLIPTMSFNADGLWNAKQRGQAGKIGEPSRIQHWNTLLERMRTEKERL